MAPTPSASERTDDLPNDVKVLKELMLQQENLGIKLSQASSEPSKPFEYYTTYQKRPTKEAFSIECDIHTGCRLHTTSDHDAIHLISPRSTTSDEEEVPVSASDFGEENHSTRKFEQLNGVAISPDKNERIQELEELYRNCHHSSRNRYSYLLDCSGEKYEHHGLSAPEGYSNFTNNFHNNIKFTSQTIVLIFLSALLITLVLSIIASVLYPVQQTSSPDEERGARRRKHWLRKTASQFITISSSPVIQDDKDGLEKVPCLSVENMI